MTPPDSLSDLLERVSGKSRNDKLNEEKVSQILSRLACGEMGKDLAAEFGVSAAMISTIKTGKWWRQVDRQAALDSVEARNLVQERFDSMVFPEPMSGCWLWMGWLNRTGYGRFEGTGVHRASWKMHKGDIPDGLWVLHHCDLPCCVNPDHPYLGTPSDNTKDAIKRGRLHQWKGARAGASNPRATVTADQVLGIKARLAQGHRSVDIVRDTGVAGHIVNSIKSGKTWSSVQ